MMKKGNSTPVQIVRWSSLSPDDATWEDYEVLHHRYPQASIWDDAASYGRVNVTHAPSVQSSEAAVD